MANFLFGNKSLMNKKAILALLLAVVVPAISYLFVKFFSERDVKMPPRHFFDSVAVNEKNGRSTYDTIWHHVQNISFTNQLGKQVFLNDVKGKVIVLDFFFTRCPTFCPGMARAMKRLQDAFKQNDTSIVQFISVSVDPLNDSVPQLSKFANKFNVNPDNWWLVTGDKKQIYNFGLQEIKASIADVNVDTGFIHTENFFLLDREKIIRGWYNGFDSSDQKRLVHDIPMLMLEKDRKKTFGEFLKELFGRS